MHWNLSVEAIISPSTISALQSVLHQYKILYKLLF